MAKEKVQKWRPAKLTDEELWNQVYQVVQKAALHNRTITIEELHAVTDEMVIIIKGVNSAE